MPDPLQSRELQQRLANPELVRKAARVLARYDMPLAKLQELREQGDPLVAQRFKDIACLLCDILAHVGIPYDEAAAPLVLQMICLEMQAKPSQWETYTNEIAPVLNARFMRELEC